MFTGWTMNVETHCPKEDREIIVHRVATIIELFIAICFN